MIAGRFNVAGDLTPSTDGCYEQLRLTVDANNDVVFYSSHEDFCILAP